MAQEDAAAVAEEGPTVLVVGGGWVLFVFIVAGMGRVGRCTAPLL